MSGMNAYFEYTFIDNERLHEYEINRINEWSGCIFIGYERTNIQIRIRDR
jgi:hypothetical protein